MKLAKLQQLLEEMYSDYIGDGCQYELDACQEAVCQNNAKCELVGDGGYKCICESGESKLKLSL